MRALTVEPGVANSIELADVPPPPPSDGDVLVRALALGICGTDREIIAGDYGGPPPGAAAPDPRARVARPRRWKRRHGSGFAPGDLVVGIVRRPDPVPCPACAAGEWDMCRNGRYTERGIKERNGYGAEQFRVEPRLRRQARSRARPARRAARAGERRRQGLGAHRAHRPAQPSLAAARRADHRRRAGRPAGGADRRAARPRIARARPQHERAEAGARCARSARTYHSGDSRRARARRRDRMHRRGRRRARRHAPHRAATASSASPACRPAATSCNSTSANFNRSMVLENDVVFGSVNANRRHYEAAAAGAGARPTRTG